MDYKEEYYKLKQRYSNRGYTIEEVTSGKLKDYAGMNNLAASDMGYPEMGKKCIHIDGSLGWKDKYQTLKHELIEHQEMSDGKSYWDAHTEALQREKYGR